MGAESPTETNVPMGSRFLVSLETASAELGWVWWLPSTTDGLGRRIGYVDRALGERRAFRSTTNCLWVGPRVGTHEAPKGKMHRRAAAHPG